MLSLLRSDWFRSMMAGFALGAMFVMAQQPAMAVAL